MEVTYLTPWNRSRQDGPAYSTNLGMAFQYRIEDFLVTEHAEALRGQVQLILTSPPFPLLSPKRYGNSQGEEYIDWLTGIVRDLQELLTPDGSLVLEIGNAWNKGEPTMSTVPLRTFLSIADKCGLHVCQQFICNNTARLPGPATWVTQRRIRVKDSFTHVWWFGKSPTPKADNRKVLKPYSPSMVRLIERRSYNAGLRPSDHYINEHSFLSDNGGAIPPSVFNLGNTATPKNYRNWCKLNQLRAHPARMQAALVDFFVNFLTDVNDIVLDPFGGSNTTGSSAQSLGRRWVITEPNSDYLLGSVGRFTD